MSSHTEHFSATIDAFNAGDADRFVELFEGGAYVSPATGRTAKGQELKYTNLGWRAAFPDMTGTIVSATESESTFAGEVVFRGTHSGVFTTVDGREIPPSGNTVEQPGAMVGHYENGTLARVVHYFDVLSMFRQTGAA